MPGVEENLSDAGGMDDFNEAVLAALRDLSTQPPLTVEIAPLLAFLVLSQLQLAFRHPLNTGKTQGDVRKLFDDLRGRVAPTGGVLDRVIEMGFDGRFDRTGDENAKR